MKSLGVILLESPVTDEQVAATVGHVYNVERVSVWPTGQVTNLNADIIVQREPVPGEFPVSLSLLATDSSGIEDFTDDEVIERMCAIARAFGQSLLTDEAGVTFEDDYLLVTPNGETIEVEVEDEGISEGRVTLTPESRSRHAELIAATKALAS